MGTFSDILTYHQALANRAEVSRQRLSEVEVSLRDCERLGSNPVTVFCAGSFARGEAGVGSDLDLFLSTEDASIAGSRLRGFELISELIRVNQQEGFPSFSNDGQFLRVYFLDVGQGDACLFRFPAIIKYW